MRTWWDRFHLVIFIDQTESDWDCYYRPSLFKFDLSTYDHTIHGYNYLSLTLRIEIHRLTLRMEVPVWKLPEPDLG